jgi:hypothetical protein
MSRSPTLIRPLVAAAAILALAAPTAFAAPIDVQSPGHPSQDVRSAHAQHSAAQPEPIQDLRMPDTRDAATRASEIQTSSAAGTTLSEKPVYWSPDHLAADPKYAAALAQEQAYSSFVKAKPIPAAATDDDTPWAIIGLGITAGVLALLAAMTAVLKTRVRRAQRVAA